MAEPREPLPIGTFTPWGWIAAVGFTGNERYYWMTDKKRGSPHCIRKHARGCELHPRPKPPPPEKKLMANNRRIKWNVSTVDPFNLWTFQGAMLCVLMDMRDDLEAIRQVLECPNVGLLVQDINRIAKNTTKPRRKVR